MPKKINLDVLIFELTDACNERCKFCYNHWKGTDNVVKQEKTNYAKTKKVLQKVFSQADVGSISFSGGEPMLFPRIHDLILFTRFHKTNVSVLTNGTLVTEQDLRIFSQLGVSRIQIPIHSANPETHDAVTQVKGSWEKSVNTVQKIVAQDADKFSTVLVLTKQNLPDLNDTLSLYHDLGIQSVLVNRFNIGGEGRKYRHELELTHTELKEAFSIINDFSRNNVMRFYSGVCTPICVLNPKDYPCISFSFCNTDMSKRPITINHAGDVRFCNHSPRVLGNVFEKPLHDILFDKSIAEYYSSTPEFCVSCQLLKTCGGGCRAASEQVYDTFAIVDPIMTI
ncbi:radical SAM protein [Paludibacter sp. 221]|uniref:radical SAM/SPASM domain-containing protein n=1 Tax=Paludibacter sp. 221 TaxID=2302939 RepID=UPI0013D15D2C|nr:radical SAM protein [Paludibacter sp. 221]NDV47705.1 radical SAM protein [Paludibacter sp. 221]